MPIDATRIWGTLYQGGEPPTGPSLSEAGFDVLVLAAAEVQPDAWRYPGMTVIRLPMLDVPEKLTSAELYGVLVVARAIANDVARKKRVLVTCQMGLNRSGLLVATALLRLTKMKPIRIISLIRQKRGVLALSNPAFVHAIVSSLSK